MHKYAVVVNNLWNDETTRFILNEIYRSQKDITIFVFNKNDMVANPFPVFNISDLWNWRGVTIVAAVDTLEKADAYPILEPIIVIGKVPNRICVESFNFDLIEKVVDEYYARHTQIERG